MSGQDSFNQPIKLLLDRYLSNLATKDLTRKHIEEKTRMLYRIVGNLRAKTVSDITIECVQRLVKRLKLSPKSEYQYFSAVNSMMNWAVKTREKKSNGEICPIIPFNHLFGILTNNPVVKTERRALTEDEIRKLFSAPFERARINCINFSLRKKLSRKVIARFTRIAKRDRLLYIIAIYTGLRSIEIKKLLWRDLNLDFGTLHVRREVDKGRVETTLPLHRVVIEELKIICGKNPSGTLIKNTPIRFNANLYKDLNHETIPAIDEYDRVINFHSLRVTFATHLSRVRVEEKALRELIRHRNSRDITYSVYVKTDLEKMKESVNRLPDWRQ